MTINELRAFIQKEVIKLYVEHLVKENELDEDFGEKLHSDCMENPEVCMSQPEPIIDPRPEM